MLTQLLCELDGLKDRRDLIIIGATNRPKTLDPALIRPGRLSQIIYIDLPGKKKRFELLKFYSKTKNNNINWDFFANQTTGLSAAHLSASLNISLLKIIYNSINLKKKEKVKLLNTFNNNKISILQNFETIEYGIQTIKFSNSSFQYKCYESGLLFNSLAVNYNYYNQLKLINKFDFSKFILNYNLCKFKINNKKNWLNIKPTKEKLSLVKQILRTIFYKKNRKFIRSLYLLNKKQSINKKIKNDSSLILFNKYINRVFKVHIFSCRLLIFSTYIINNPLILSFNIFYNYSTNLLYYNFSTILNKLNQLNKTKLLIFDQNFIIFKYNNLLKYKLIYYNFKLTNNIFFSSNKKFFYKNTKIFSINKNINILNNANNKNNYLNTKNYFDLYYKTSFKKQKTIQQSLFSDSLFINRIAYYLGGKALILTIFKKPMSNFNTLNLWLIKNKVNSKIKKKLFIEQFIKKLITKQDFEHFLFFILSGKIAETKMLLNTNSKNFSNFTCDELKEVSWLLNIMINKKFFYKPLKFKLLKQNLIQNSKKSFNKINKKTIKKNYNTKQQQKLFLLINQFDKPFLLNQKMLNNYSFQRFDFWTLIPYWWEPNLKVKNINIMHWSIFFKKSKKLNFLTLLLKESSKYYYFYNTYTNISTNFIQYNSINNKFTNKINSNLIESFNYNQKNNFLKSEINWNNIFLIEYNILISNLIINYFNKIFNLFYLNTELMDYLIYYILCNERCYDFELNKISLKYYNF